MKNTTFLSRRNLTATLSAFPALIALGSPVLAEGSFTDLGNLGGDYIYSTGLSGNGAVVVGYGNTITESWESQRAFRWENGVMQNLGAFSPFGSYATAVSADGAVVVGSSAFGDSYEQHAFRWKNNVMQDLGTLGGTYSSANAVSANGSVIVGSSNLATDYSDRAFRWEGGVMQDLGTLGGSFSYAQFVSDDGAVVVGQSTLETGYEYRVFRWEDGVIQNIGSLGGSYTYANKLSADGAVIVGQGFTESSQWRAFRWDASTGIQSLGTLSGGAYSYASDVSANGAVVVGSSSLGDSPYTHAFRWESGVMADLGTLAGYTNSDARAVSADGRVVVGSSSKDSEMTITSFVLEEGPNSQAFRWSTTEGMQSVNDWVTAAGGAIPDGYALTYATDVNDDGSVVIGQGRYNGNDVIWLAKGNGFLSDTEAFDRSVIQAGGSATSVGIATSNLALGGSHHRTLLDSGLAMSENGTCAWSTVDAARNDTTKTTTTLGEIGLCGDVAGYRIGAGVGTTKTNQDWDLGGSARYTGDYLLAEVDREFATAGGSTLQASLLVYHANFNTTLNRAYASGAGIDVSTGRPDLKTSAVKARLDWKNATTMGAFSVSPYSTLTVTRAKVAGYTEAGGAFPAVYAPTTTNTTDLRIGAAFSGKIAEKTTLHTQIEAAHQFQNATSGINGQVTGLYAFSLPGQKLTQNWARITMDVDYALTPSTVLTAGFNAATKGNQSSAGITLGLRAAF